MKKPKNDLDVIRVETVLSRYPVHRLAKAGPIEIVIRDQSSEGDRLRWKVTYNLEYGQPGPLAYKLDTHVINRRLDAAGKPTPGFVRLGSLKEIARELGLGGSTNQVKEALFQNAFAAISAKIDYKAVDGTGRSVEIADTRYGVVFRGQTLPDGRRADVVYIVLHDFFREILDHAPARPLDYDYLRSLAPAAQRWYELASYKMFAALRNGRPVASLAYSEFCTHAPQTRYLDFDRTKKQMYKIHSPHRESGYIASVAYEPTTDREGRPDWLMLYEPGLKARAEFSKFMGDGRGRGAIALVAPVPATPGDGAPEGEGGPEEVESLLVERGVTPAVAAELAREFGADRVRAQVEGADWIKAKSPRKIADLGAYLVKAIREDFSPPPGLKAQAERAERAAAAAAVRALEDDRRRAERDEATRREADLRAAWADLDEAEKEAIRAKVAAETPLLARHPRLLEASCLEAVGLRGRPGDDAG